MSANLSFFAPLTDARTVPMPRPKMSSGAKRPVSASASSGGPNKRAKPATAAATKTKTTRPALPVTPHASSDDAPASFKMPSLPSVARLVAPLTPSTSTVAGSSSPRRSSPRSALGEGRGNRRVTPPAVPVRLEAGTTLVFGRHHMRGGQASRPLAAPPAALERHLAYPDNLARTVILNRAARHASRVHAAAELVSTPEGRDVIRLIVMGQNGLRVREGGGVARRRLTPGTVEEFSTRVPLEVDFYGAAVTISADEEERLFSPEPEQPHMRAASPLSLPPSSPPVAYNPLENEDEDEDEDEDENDDAPEDRRELDRMSSPLSELGAPDQFTSLSSDLSGPSEPSEEQVAVKTELVAASVLETPAPAPVSRPTSRANTPARNTPARPNTPAHPKSRHPTPPPVEIPPVPAALDLPAILVSTVVFSGSSKLSLPDLVRSLLESQPSLRVHGPEPVWSAWAAAELDTNPMFGKVARNGKDSSGHPLQPHYYYDPSHDPDPSRAREFGGLVRPLRAAQRAGGKAIDWRPVGGGRRRY